MKFTRPAFAGLVLIAAAAHAQAPTTNCTNTTLKGSYVFQGNGEKLVLNLLNLIVLQQRVETAGSLVFDGNGNVTSSNVEVLVDGQSNANTDVGTYTVNADCSGTLSLNDPTEPLQFTFAAARVDPATGIANNLEGEDDANGFDLDVSFMRNSEAPESVTAVNNVLSKDAVSTAPCSLSFTFLLGNLKGGSGAEVDSALIGLKLTQPLDQTSGTATLNFFKRKINGATVSPSTTPFSGTFTENPDCSFKGTVTGGGTTYTFTGAPGTYDTSSGAAIRYIPLTLSDGTRGLSGTASPAGLP